MKKVLFGLLALSSISMAAAVDLGAPATADTNVFQTGQQGAIVITGTVTSEVPVVKYVVYASADNGTNKSDIWTLPNFILSQDASTGGYATTPTEKLYVKRITGNPGAEAEANLESSDAVSFKIQVDPLNTAINAYNWIANGGEYSYSANQLIARAELDKMIPTLTGVTLNSTTGDFVKDGKYYRTRKTVEFASTANGELITRNANDPNYSSATTMTDSATITAIETAFAAGKPIGNVKVLVKVD